MSFQWIIDYAETISVERKQVTATSTSRSGVVRTVSRGAAPWRFEVKLPDGMLWTNIRNYISKAEALDRHTAANIQFNTTGMEWFVKYQGNSANYTGFYCTYVQGNNYLTLTTSPTTSSGYKFKAGDLIQLPASGKVYTVAADVAYNSNTVYLHRPILETTRVSPGQINVGPNCVFNVVCSQFPSWTIMARDQVSWSGAFVFSEVIA
jgi:hypothetical protein